MEKSFITNYADYADIQFNTTWKIISLLTTLTTLILNTKYNFIPDYADYADFRDYNT